MEKLGQLRASDQWDLIIVDTPPSRSALDFLDAPNRMSRFLDGTMIRLLTAPAGPAAGPAEVRQRRVHVLQPDHLARSSAASCCATSPPSSRRWTRCSAASASGPTATYELLRRPGTWFVVVATPEPDALREASYFVDRLSAEGMPLAGLVLNRTHPPATTALSATRAEGAAEEVAESGADGADAGRRRRCGCTPSGWSLAAREQHLADRFTSAHPEVAVRTVPAAAGDVHDLDGLRVMAGRADRRGRGHADRHAAHPGAARAPRLTAAVEALRATYPRLRCRRTRSPAPPSARQARRDDRRRRRAAGRAAAARGSAGPGLVARNSASLLRRAARSS